MEQYDKDRRSAFVGNLPLSMSEELLQDIASSCGEVVSIQLYKKMIPGGNGTLYTLWKSFVASLTFSKASSTALVSWNSRDQMQQMTLSLLS